MRRGLRFHDTYVLFQRRGAFGDHPFSLSEAGEDLDLGEPDQPDGHRAAVDVTAADGVDEAPGADGGGGAAPSSDIAPGSTAAPGSGPAPRSHRGRAALAALTGAAARGRPPPPAPP